MYKFFPTGHTSVVALTSVLALSNSAIAAQVIDGSKARPLLESIIVVGEKTERTLKDTASSVSVITEDTLNSLQNHTISGAVSEIANVVVLNGALPDIRGVTGNGSAGGFNSITGGSKARVSTLIDGVAEPFVADLTGDSGIWDISQIEVYRGPQSTSNGRNSIGGAIYIKTKDPTFDWEGAGRVGYRNQDNYVDKAVMVSGSIIEDTLAFRVNAQRLDAQTITDDSGFATNAPDYDLNEIETQRYKAKLLWAPVEDLDLLLTYSSNEERGDTGRVYYAADDPWAFNRIFYRNIDTQSDTTSLKLGYRVSDNVSVDILAAHIDYQWGFDSYEPTDAAEQQLVFDQSSKSLDVKVNFGEGNEALNGFVGLAYFERDQDFESTGVYAYDGKDTSDSQALYSEVTFGLTDRLDVTAGLRVEREEQSRSFNYTTFGKAGELENAKTITLPKVVLQYAATDNTTLALSARSGYNAPGGAFAFGSGDYYYYDEETVNTFEASARSSLFDGDVSVSANLFYNDYDGYQALNSLRAIVNMDEVVTYGAEFEVLASLGAKTQLSAGLGLLETEIKDAGSDYAGATGNDLNSAPAVTANMGVTYQFTQAFKMGVSVNYVDEYYGDINNTKERVAGDYTLTRLTANYETEHWVIAAFVNNAFDEQAFTNQEPVGRSYPDGYVSVVDPRTAGASVTYMF